MGLEPSILFDPGGVWILWANHLMNHFKHNKNLSHKDDTPPLVEFRRVWNLPFTTPQISLISSNKTHPSRLNKLQPTSLWKRKTEKKKHYPNLTHLADCFSCSFIAAKKHSHRERLQRHRYHPRSKFLLVKAFAQKSKKFTVKTSVAFFWAGDERSSIRGHYVTPYPKEYTIFFVGIPQKNTTRGWILGL